MCFYKYEMSGRTVLHNVICVEWLKIGNCANFEVRHKIVVTDNLLSLQEWFYSLMLQEKLCHDIIPFIVTKVHMNFRKYVGTFLIMSRHKTELASN